MHATTKAFSLAATVIVMAILAFLVPKPAAILAVLAGITALAGAMAGIAEGYSSILGALEAEREPRHARVAEGVPVTIRLTVRNPASKGLPSILIRDEAPPRARPEEAVYQGVLPPQSGATATYTIRPAPGLIRIRRLSVEAHDPLGLYATSRVIDLVSTIQVYPAPYPPSLERPGAGLGLVEATFSHRRGWGAEFYSLREYVPGDDVRLVAWLPSARAGRLLVRENVEPRRLDVCMIVDLSLESWAGSPGESPADWVMRASLGVASVVARGRGRIGYAVLLGEAALRLDPSRAADSMDAMAEAFTVASPEHATRRRGLPRLLRDAEGWPSTCVILLLLGPGGLGLIEPEHVETIAWRLVAVEVLPTGSSELEAAIREAYSELERRRVERLRDGGVQAFLVSSPAQLATAVSVGVSEVARRIYEYG